MKKILTVLALLFLVLIIAGGYFAYQFFGTDHTVEKELEEQFTKEFFSFDDILNSSKRSPSEGEKQEDESQEDTSTEQSGNSEQGSSSTDQSGTSQGKPPAATEETGNQTEPVTEQSIVNSYVSTFTSLEDAATEKLNDLFNAGYQEYVQQKEDGTLQMITLSKKYMQAAQKLEKSLDDTFYSLLGEMEEELNEHGFPTTEVKKIEKQYKDKIKQLKSEFMAKLR